MQMEPYTIQMKVIEHKSKIMLYRWKLINTNRKLYSANKKLYNANGNLNHTVKVIVLKKKLIQLKWNFKKYKLRRSNIPTFDMPYTCAAYTPF